MEGIMAMGEPTIAEFSRMMQISTPNAAYKIGSLVKKGYVEKIQSTTDRREYHLRPTQKYIDYYNISYSYLHTGGDAHHCEHRADARVGYAQEGRKGRISNKELPDIRPGVLLFPLTSALYLLPGSCPSSTAHRR